MKVSVFSLTYQHAPYIRCAINSVMMQQTDFDYEYVIIDDVSTDGTRDILRSYQSRFPDRIRVVLADRNGSSRRLLREAIQSTSAQYVAYLDGDDCWLSPNKLQTLVEQMDRDPRCAIAFHNVVQFWQEGTKPPALNNCPRRLSGTLGFQTLLFANVIAGCAQLMRREFLDEFPDWFDDEVWSDWPLYIICARHGHLRFNPGIMGAYRKHPAGVWTSLSQEDQFRQVKRFLAKIDRYLNHEWTDAIQSNIAHWDGLLERAVQREAERGNAAEPRDNPSQSDPWPLAGVSVPAGLMLGLGYDPSALLRGVDFSLVDRSHLRRSIADAWRAGVFAAAASGQLGNNSESAYHTRVLDYARWLAEQAGGATTGECSAWVDELGNQHPLVADPCRPGRCTGWEECKASLPSSHPLRSGAIT